MMPIDFSGFDRTLKGGAQENSYENVPCVYLKDESGHGSYITAWKPNQSDLEAINRGEPIFVKITCPEGNLWPFGLYTFDQNNNVNQL